MHTKITDSGRIKRGRGQGIGASYQPWIRVHDFSSSGLVTRVYSILTGRVHHLLSRMEEKTFYFMEFQRPSDIREQYPLELKETIEIAGLAGIRHPTVNGNYVVMSTDFLVYFEDGPVAISVKPSSKLNERTLGKLEIERRYFERRSIPFYIVTEKEIPEMFVQNIQLARAAMRRPNLIVSDAIFVNILKEVSVFGLTVEQALRKIALDKLVPYDYPELKKLFLHLVWDKKINVFDMDSKDIMELKNDEYAAAI